MKTILEASFYFGVAKNSALIFIIRWPSYMHSYFLLLLHHVVFFILHEDCVFLNTFIRKYNILIFTWIGCFSSQTIFKHIFIRLGKAIYGTLIFAKRWSSYMNDKKIKHIRIRIRVLPEDYSQSHFFTFISIYFQNLHSDSALFSHLLDFQNILASELFFLKSKLCLKTN